MKVVESIPHAARTFHALRRLGYDVNSSIADIVDNSITEKTKAENISIIFKRDKNGFICRIQDNGKGMTEQELEEAMRIGTEMSYGKHDLGRYGMGMKTASLSHCDILTVISKARKSGLAGYRWDMSHVESTGKWSLFKLTKEDIENILKKEQWEILTSGTIVFWDKMKLLNEEYASYSSQKLADNFYYKLLGELGLHIRMTFHRFLDGSAGKNNLIEIRINDNKPLTPWDPFCRDEKNTIEIDLKKGIGELKTPGFANPVMIHGYILPTREGFSSRNAWEEAKGLLSWNDAQGYYIYRANRLIRFGGWHGTKAKDEHDKLARLSVDIDPSLDKLFRITVNKNRLQFPEQLYYHLKTKVNPKVIRLAQRQYRRSGERHKVKNPVRSNLPEVAKDLVAESKIKIEAGEGKHSQDVAVTNPSGTWLANKIKEFFKYGSSNDFEIVSDKLENDHLWKIVCNEGDKFKVIVNSRHPFYQKVYTSGHSKSFTKIIDALIFSLAFSELYNRNEQNSHLLDTFKGICSLVLKRLIKEKLI